MAADPEAIRELEADSERRQRSWREQPKESFGEVLSQTPAKGELVEDADTPAARPTQAHVKAPDPRMQALHARFGSVPDARVRVPREATPMPAETIQGKACLLYTSPSPRD